jgi:dTMP kinase
VGHQGGKIKDKKQREKYLKWLFDLEFNLFGIPKPDFTFVLKVSPLISQDLVGRITDRKKKAKKKSFLGKEKRDLHEKDISHLINAQNSYLEAVKEFPRDFTLIDCIEENTLLPAKSIHEKVWEKIKKII